MAKEEDKKHFEIASYVMGVLSLVFSIILQPSFGLGFGITGLILSKNGKSETAMRGKKLSTIGIVISVIVLIVLVYLSVKQVLGSGSIPQLA